MDTLLARPAAAASHTLAGDPASATRTPQRLLWVAFAFFLAGVGVGTGWDRRWHASHPFEDFWSPPHLFIYANVLIAAAVVAYITFRPRLRVSFGNGEALVGFPFRVPGPLMLLDAGFVVVGLGGLCDGIWHTAFGLNETSFSLPHAMLGRGILLTTLGFVACQLALGKPLHWLAIGILGWVTLGVAVDLIGGPILRNPPRDGLRALAALPVLAADTAFQHTTRIYLDWHLDRTNPLYLPLIAFTVGFALRLLQRLTGPRDRWLVAVASIGLVLGLFENGTSFLARLLLTPPFLPAALGYALVRRVGFSDRWVWLGAGCGATLASLIWVHVPLLAIASAPLAMLGAWFATTVLHVVEAPTRRAVLTLVVLIGVCSPVVTGAVDLYWRMHTP